MNIVKKEETNGYELRELASRMGIYIHYLIPMRNIKSLRLPGEGIYNIIINHNHHWIAIFIEKKHMYYFNSFSSNYEEVPGDVKLFARRNHMRTITDSIKSIQDVNYGYCGQYCIDFLYYMNKKGQPNAMDYQMFLNRYVWVIDQV